MIIVTLQLKVNPEKRWDIVKTIHTIIGPTAVQPGCVHCSLYSNTGNDDELILLQKWESKEALEKHIRSDNFRKILATMEESSEPPELSFDTVSFRAGLDLVEKLRKDIIM